MSAVSASPADGGVLVVDKVPLDKVRALQHTLYRTAKAEPERRFHALWDKVLRRDVLWRGWVAVRANNGAPGVDRTTLDWIEREYGIDRLLGELSCELRDGSYRPLPARRVYIPKPGTTEQRPLSIPAVRDRIVQAALKIVLEPIFEADFAPCSFGFRPKRGQHDALQVLVDETGRGRRWVVETDVANCFSAIPHDRLMTAVQERVCDQSVLKLLRAMLRAGVMESGVVHHPDTGTPQGGVVSPLMCNVYLHRLDRAWDTRAFGVLVRFADDLLVVCKSRQQAQAALARLRQLLAELGLEPKEAKTRIVELVVGGEGFDFLGFHHRMVRSRGVRGRRGMEFLARWPSDRAMRRAREQIRGLTPPVSVAVAGRGGRGGPEQVPAWLGGLFPLRPLHELFWQASALCHRSALVVHWQTAQTRTRLRPVGARLQVGGPMRVVQPEWNRDRTQGQQALAGETECRR